MKFSKKNNIVVLFAVILIAVIFMLITRGSKQKPLEGPVRGGISPVAGFFSGVGYWFNDKFSFFSEISSLKMQNKNLYEENLNLKGSLAKLEDVKRENEEMRSQIDLAPREDYSLISALVVGKDLSSQGEIIHLNRGKKDGVREQMAVVVGDGVLVGKISRVFESSCDVELLINRVSKINAEIVKNGSKGIARGQFGTSLVLDMIPQTVKIDHGDTVITSGVGGLLPRGLLVGYTQDATPTSDQLFQKTSLILPVQFDQLRVVWIVEGGK